MISSVWQEDGQERESLPDPDHRGRCELLYTRLWNSEMSHERARWGKSVESLAIQPHLWLLLPLNGSGEGWWLMSWHW